MTVAEALELADVDYRHDRADKVWPTEDGIVLGRVLAVLGAPVGPRAEQHLELPTYLDDAPADVRETSRHRPTTPLKSKRERDDLSLEQRQEIAETPSTRPLTVENSVVHFG